MRHTLLWVIVAAAGLACAAARADDKPYFRSFLGERPPEFVTEPHHWVNTGQPPTFAQLRGKTIWLQFNF